MAAVCGLREPELGEFRCERLGDVEGVRGRVNRGTVTARHVNRSKDTGFLCYDGSLGARERVVLTAKEVAST